MNKSFRILNIIAVNDGMRFTDIQRILWEMTHPKGTFTRRVRGYWCTNLLGGMHYHAGLLRHFCTKGPDGLWRRNEKPLTKKPWREVNAAGSGYRSGGWFQPAKV